MIAYENKDYQNALQYFEDANELSYKLYGERDYAYTGHIIQMKYLLKDSSYEKDRDSLLTIWQPNSDIVKNLKVHFLININEIEKAIDLISDIQRENSEEPYFYLLKAIIYCRENELKKSIMFFTKALEHKDNQDKPDFEPFMYYWGSIIYYKDDNIDLAQEYFNKAIQFEDDSYKIRGIALMYMHSFKEDEFEILRYLDNNNE